MATRKQMNKSETALPIDVSYNKLFRIPGIYMRHFSETMDPNGLKSIIEIITEEPFFKITKSGFVDGFKQHQTWFAVYTGSGLLKKRNSNRDCLLITKTGVLLLEKFPSTRPITVEFFIKKQRAV